MNWVIEEDAIRLETNDAMMVRWIYNINPEDKIYAEELRASLKLFSLRERLQDKRLQWFCHVERMEKST